MFILKEIQTNHEGEATCFLSEMRGRISVHSGNSHDHGVQRGRPGVYRSYEMLQTFPGAGGVTNGHYTSD